MQNKPNPALPENGLPQNKHQLEWARNVIATQEQNREVNDVIIVNDTVRLAQAVIADAETVERDYGNPLPTGKVTRFEVVDSIGRVFTKWDDKPFDIEFSYQDDGKTLKAFLKDVEAAE
jgi:hypothetical protein